MAGWVVDTNVVSELRKPRCDVNVLRWHAAQPAWRLHVSRVTFAEIRVGFELLAMGEARAALQLWLDEALRPWFADRALDVTEDVLVAWRHRARAVRRAGRTLADADGLIAATALVHGMGVATRNVADFADAGIAVVDPWASTG